MHPPGFARPAMCLSFFVRRMCCRIQKEATYGAAVDPNGSLDQDQRAPTVPQVAYGTGPVSRKPNVCSCSH